MSFLPVYDLNKNESLVEENDELKPQNVYGKKVKCLLKI